MCCLLLVSTTGISYAQHFCGDFEIMATLTLGEEKLSCGMVTMADDACSDEKEEGHSCCDNQYTKITTDENFNPAQDTFQLPTNFLAAFVSVFVFQTKIGASNKNVEFSEYNPPPLIKNISVLYETFLI